VARSSCIIWSMMLPYVSKRYLKTSGMDDLMVPVSLWGSGISTESSSASWIWFRMVFSMKLAW